MTTYGDRAKCYKCYRPQSSCMCSFVHTIDTDTKFIVLMHPKEFKKTKNGTGHFTRLSLSNSHLFVGVDFSNHETINEIIDTHDSFILYPSKDAINMSKTTPYTPKSSKKMAIFLIDSTWACANKMLHESKNLQKLQHISFSSTKLSEFKIKEQPKEYCLSTMESTLSVLELLDKWKIESIEKEDLDKFLNPFHEMVKYQLKCIADSPHDAVRFRCRKSK